MDQGIAAVISAAIAVVGTLGGVVIAALIQREAKKIASLERRVERYKAEIRSRQCEEDVAAEWLVELGVADSLPAAKVRLRNRTEERKGLRPNIGPSEVRE